MHPQGPSCPCASNPEHLKPVTLNPVGRMSLTILGNMASQGWSLGCFLRRPFCTSKRGIVGSWLGIAQKCLRLTGFSVALTGRSVPFIGRSVPFTGPLFIVYCRLRASGLKNISAHFCTVLRIFCEGWAPEPVRVCLNPLLVAHKPLVFVYLKGALGAVSFLMCD